LSFTRPVIDSKDPVNYPYCGAKNLKSAPACTMFKDFNNKKIIFVKPYDPFLVLVWLGRTQNDVVKDDQNEFFKMVRV